ncbi:MAG: hypothetical protein NC206_08470 [Bacteroides sp.]|nr:hypothetical protein [Roseburia sp.]MCM1347103.1 hypothetical protein [Bacteroides sp.]MCM1420716.1 hypothetical protein [Bacteroides sp.]
MPDHRLYIPAEFGNPQSNHPNGTLSRHRPSPEPALQNQRADRWAV